VSSPICTSVERRALDTLYPDVALSRDEETVLDIVLARPEPAENTAAIIAVLGEIDGGEGALSAVILSKRKEGV